MSTIWILVANQAEARIYSADRIPRNLILVETLIHEEGAAHARDLTSDAPGRVHDRMGSSRHSMEPDTGVKEEGRRRFVKEMVARLESAHFRGDYDRLVLLAAPAVLGVIRKTLSNKLTKAVIKEISKDVIGQDLDKIQAQLQRSFELK
jgi:protein required for attachment to host cells